MENDVYGVRPPTLRKLRARAAAPPRRSPCSRSSTGRAARPCTAGTRTAASPALRWRDGTTGPLYDAGGASSSHSMTPTRTRSWRSPRASPSSSPPSSRVTRTRSGRCERAPRTATGGSGSAAQALRRRRVHRGHDARGRSRRRARQREAPALPQAPGRPGYDTGWGAGDQRVPVRDHRRRDRGVLDRPRARHRAARAPATPARGAGLLQGEPLGFDSSNEYSQGAHAPLLHEHPGPAVDEPSESSSNGDDGPSVPEYLDGIDARGARRAPEYINARWRMRRDGTRTT